MGPELPLLSSSTLPETKDNGAQSLENSNGHLPARQDLRNMDADFGYSNYHQPFEAFNLLNRTNFRAPNGNRSAAGFGTITSTYDPRQLQHGFKLLW